MTASTRLRHLVTPVLLLLALTAGVSMRTAHVRGASMDPTLADGQILVIESASYRITSPRRGDVVVVHVSDEQWLLAGLTGGRYVKRVVGLPGETLAISQGTVLVDGVPLDEPYVRLRSAAATTQTHTVVQDVPAVVIPADAYYVLGDNRGASDDSRTWGPVPESAVLGRAASVVWPHMQLRLR